MRIEESIKKDKDLLALADISVSYSTMFLNTLDLQKEGTGIPGRCLHPCVLYLMSMKVGYFFSGIRIKIREIVFNLLEHTKNML